MPAHYPALLEAVMVMPDMHQGYGFPIGGVAATDLKKVSSHRRVLVMISIAACG
jgi:RNA-splicing ligase RtcB